MDTARTDYIMQKRTERWKGVTFALYTGSPEFPHCCPLCDAALHRLINLIPDSRFLIFETPNILDWRLDKKTRNSIFKTQDSIFENRLGHTRIF